MKAYNAIKYKVKKGLKDGLVNQSTEARDNKANLLQNIKNKRSKGKNSKDESNKDENKKKDRFNIDFKYRNFHK